MSNTNPTNKPKAIAKNYAPLWKKLSIVGGVLVTVGGLLIAQSLTSVNPTKDSTFLAVADFAAGNSSATIITTDGDMYSRGWNNLGQLGVEVGSKVNVTDWTKMELPEKMKSVSITDHAVALSESGKLYTWGGNENGQIGNGSTNSSFTPTQITATARYSQITAGEAFSVAIDSEGRLWSWGANNAGQLGDGTTTSRSTPKLISSKSFRNVYASKETAFALSSDGQLWAWGANNAGQLGDGTKASKNKPTLIDTGKSWSQIAVNQKNNTVLGIDSSGWIYSWGDNTNGLLGNGTDWRKLQKEEDARFAQMIEDIKRDDEIRKQSLINQCASDAYDAAMKIYDADFKVYEEKVKAQEEADRQKAEEEEKNKPQPSATPSPSATPKPSATPAPTATPTAEPTPKPVAPVKPVIEDFIANCTTQVEKDFKPTDTSKMKAAVIKAPALKPAHLKPEVITDAFQVKDAALGSENGYLVDVNNQLYSWGKDANGQTGIDIDDATSLTQVPVFVREEVADVSAGDKYGVAVASNGDLLLWGSNPNGVLLSDPATVKSLKVPTVKGADYTTVTAGLNTVYAFKNTTVFTWGSNASGELGTENANKSSATANEMERKMTTVAPYKDGALSLNASNQLMFWGVNNVGQFGNSTTSNEPVRKAAMNTVSEFVSTTAGDKYSVAVDKNGNVWGWGSNASRMLDLEGDMGNRLYPVLMATELQNVTLVAGGSNISAMTDGNKLVIWSGGVPREFTLEGITSLEAGDNHVVVLAKDGHVWNWSLNESGTRQGTKAETMTQVDDRIYKKISAAGASSAAITSDGELIIWGSGSEKMRLGKTEGEPVPNFAFENVSLAGNYVLANDSNHVLWGWGENPYLVLGGVGMRNSPTVLTQTGEEVASAKLVEDKPKNAEEAVAQKEAK